MFRCFFYRNKYLLGEIQIASDNIYLWESSGKYLPWRNSVYLPGKYSLWKVQANICPTYSSEYLRGKYIPSKYFKKKNRQNISYMDLNGKTTKFVI